MKEYETIYILRSNTSEKEIKEVEDRLNHLIQQHKGAIVNQQSLGKRPLAYTMAKEKEGLYWCLHYTGNGVLVSEVERILHFDERVIRFMTTAVNDAAASRRA